MSSVLPDRRQVNVRTLFETALQAAHAALLAALSARMNELLGQAVDHLLGRPRYVRRGHVADAIQGGRCPHCQRRRVIASLGMADGGGQLPSGGAICQFTGPACVVPVVTVSNSIWPAGSNRISAWVRTSMS